MHNKIPVGKAGSLRANPSPSIVAAVCCLCVALVLHVAPARAAGPHVEPITQYLNSHLRRWIGDPVIVHAVKAQNAANSGLTLGEIRTRDAEWRSETESENRPMIDKILANRASVFLRQRQEDADGTITEIILMDAHGINVAQSDVTSDFWQGDEEKFTKTFLAGPNAVFVDDALKDASSQMFQAQVAVTIVDENGIPIGAIAVGINLDQL